MNPQELHKLAEAATPGLFTVFSVYAQHEVRTPSGTCIAATMRREDAKLIAAALNAQPELLDKIDQLQAEQDAKNKALLAVARMAEDLKQECGQDPESPQAIRNGKYMNISYAAHAAMKEQP
jgi:hypothetical protein